MTSQHQTKAQYHRKARSLRSEVLRETQRESELRLDHHIARDVARTRRSAQSLDPETKQYVNVSLRYCGLVEGVVAWCPDDGTFSVRIEGAPEVDSIKLHVRNPSSSKSLTRAMRYALVFLEKHGAVIYGTSKRADGTYDVRVSP